MEVFHDVDRKNGSFNLGSCRSYRRGYVNLSLPRHRVYTQNEVAIRTMSLSIYDKASSIIEAVTSNDLEKVMELVRSGYILQVDKDGKSPVHVAAENGHYDIVKYLLMTFPMHNVNSPDQFGNTALHKAAHIGHVEMIKVLLERGAQVNVQEMAGLFTPLHMAVQSGHNQSARNLIKYGADLAAKNKFGDTPLHTAVRYGHAGVSRIIISVSTNVNYQNQNGDTALHIAAALKRRKIIRLLIEAGALLDIRNYQNESPVDVAAKKNHKEILEILSLARTGTVATKTVSFNPEMVKQFFPTHNEDQEVVEMKPPKPPRVKIKSKKVSIVKGIFSRKKKDKVDKGMVNFKEDAGTGNPPLTPSKSILCSSKRKNSDTWKSGVRVPTTTTSMATPVPGLMNIYQSQYGNLFFKDLAGNIKQGPIGFTPMGNAYNTCNCSQITQASNRNNGNLSPQSNICLDHGYVDYHGPMSQYQNDTYTSKSKKRGKENSDQCGYPLVKSKSDESLNQSEHKLRMQEERIKEAKVANEYSSPVKGRRQSAMTSNWSCRQNSLIKDFSKDQNSQKIPFQVSLKNKESKDSAFPIIRPFDMMRTTMRPSPDGQTDLVSTPVFDQPKIKVDWRAGKYRPDKVVLPSSKV